MKALIVLVLIGLTLSKYDPAKGAEYAKKYCKHYNKNYNNYANSGGDCANFVSQCLIAGGLNLKDCPSPDKHGCIPYVPNLKTCLSKKGFKSSTSKPKHFKAGYPVIFGSYHATIASEVNGDKVYLCAHTNDHCNSLLTSSWGSPIIYYYL